MNPTSIYIFIDFPTYHFHKTEGVLVSFNGTFGSGKERLDPYAVGLIIGEDASPSGSTESGAMSSQKKP